MAKFIELGLTTVDNSFWDNEPDEAIYDTYFINIDKIISLEEDRSYYEGTFLTIEGFENRMYSIDENPFEIMGKMKEMKEGKD